MMDRDTYEIGKHVIMDDMVVANNIYVDIEFLKYIKLGAILSHQELTADVYTGIVNKVKDPSFLLRSTDDTEIVFSEVKNIELLFKIPSKMTDDVVFGVSPTFDDASELIGNCIIKSDASKRLLKDKKPISITIDVSILPGLSDNMCERIKAEYTSFFGCEIHLIRKKMSVDDQKAAKFDIYYVSNIVHFNDMMIKHLDGHKLLSKYIICSKLLPLSLLPDLKEDLIPKFFSNMEIVMVAASRFRYIKPFPCLTQRIDNDR